MNAPYIRSALNWNWGGPGISAFRSPGRKVSCGCTLIFCLLFWGAFWETELQESWPNLVFLSNPQLGPCRNLVWLAGAWPGKELLFWCLWLSLEFWGPNSPVGCARPYASLFSPHSRYFSGLFRTSTRAEGSKQKEGKPQVSGWVCLFVDLRENYQAPGGQGHQR